MHTARGAAGREQLKRDCADALEALHREDGGDINARLAQVQVVWRGPAGAHGGTQMGT